MRINNNIIKSLLLATIGLTVSTFPIHAEGKVEWETGREGYYPQNAYTDSNLISRGEQLYICSALHNNGENIPGKLHPSHRKCYVSFGGKEYGYGYYAVLTGNKYQWVKHTGAVPQNAIGGGRRNGERLYVCMAWAGDAGWIPGKFHPSHDKCYIPYGGREYGESDFYILTDR